MWKPGDSGIPRTVAEVDWESWRPVDRGTILFVVREDRILPIRKKRGLGAGKINGPGGRIDEGETPLECAVREVEEELLVKPSGVSEGGELLFQFVDGYSIHVWVFRATEVDGEAGETDEAVPLWTHVDEIPYDEMWADDRIWLPLFLASRPFVGRFVFDDDRMLDHEILAPPSGPGS